jgi:spore germination protein
MGIDRHILDRERSLYMIIHTVQAGETINSIAKRYNVSPQKIIRDNELKNPGNLVTGQTLVILFPDQVHIVKPGETLEEIARANNTTTVVLLQNNPYITPGYVLKPGDEVVLSYTGEKQGNIQVIGYAYPFIDRNVLLKTLPYLTYLTIFTYGITPEGELIEINDEPLIEMARNYGVAPLMLISTLTEQGTFSNELAHTILNDQNVQNNLIENILNNLKAKKYYGLDVDFEYILPEDKEAYIKFIDTLTTRLNAEGFQVFTALAPKVSSTQPGLLYEAHDYGGIGNASNNVLLMTYEWGFTYGPPMAVAPADKVREVLNYAVTEIDPKKIFMGIPNYGYDFTLPYVQGKSKADSISNVEGVDIARREGAQIQYDRVSQAPFFRYRDDQGRTHEVWFEDARSVRNKLEMSSEYGFKGVGYWNIMTYFPQNWLVMMGLYNIAKLV